jgi:hypothetical protein
MNLDVLNKWLTLAANLGVMGGLVLVAMQMNFNTETMRLQNASDLTRGFAAGELTMMGDTSGTAWTTAVLHPEELTEAQLGGQLWSYFNNIMWVAQNNWLAYNDGLASEDSWSYAKKFAATSLGFRVGRIWWELARQNYEPDFAKAIDAELAGVEPEIVEHSLRQMLDRVRKLDRSEVSLTPSRSVPGT